MYLCSKMASVPCVSVAPTHLGGAVESLSFHQVAVALPEGKVVD